jgi:hypothetical protein
LNEIIKDLYLKAKENWTKPLGLLLMTFVIAFGFQLSVGFDPSKMNKIFWIIHAIVESGLIIYWFYYRRKRFCPLGKIGIVISLQTQNSNQYEKFEHDFITRIRKGLGSEHFWIDVLPYNQAKKIYDKTSMLESLNETKAHLLITCFCSEGKQEGKDSYEVQMNCLVKHAHLDPETQKNFQEELNEITIDLILNKEDEFTSFKFSSDYLIVYSRYIIGLASMLSLDFHTAIHLFETLKSEFPDRLTIKPLAVIRKRIKENLSFIYYALSVDEYHHLRNSKDYDHLEKSNEYINLIRENEQQIYHYHCQLHLAIYQFLKNRNVKGAKQILTKLSNVKDSSHFYSMAFLNAYEGNLRGALNFYKRALKMPQPSGVSIEVEEFIDHILSVEPDKYHLYLCLALINLYKGDHQLVGEDLERFLEVAKEEDHKYIAVVEEITKKLGISLENPLIAATDKTSIS